MIKIRHAATLSLAGLAMGLQPAEAAFSNYTVRWWRGNWIYSGDTLLTTGSSYQNSRSIMFTTNSAPLTSGTSNYFQAAILAKSPGIAINNQVNAVIQSVLAGNAGAYAAGVAIEDATTIKNSGTIDTTVTAATGEAYGIFANAGAVDIVNEPQGRITANSPGHAVGLKLFWTQSQSFRNYGTVAAKSTGPEATGPHTAGDSWRDSSAEGIDSFVYKTGPTYIENNGKISVDSISSKMPAIGMFLWNNFSTVTLINNGILTSRNTGGKAGGVYMGTLGYDMTFKNTGAWIADGTDEKEGGVWGVWLENDGDSSGMTKGKMNFTNSGTIATNDAFAVHIGSYGPGPWDQASFVNTGSISGNWLGLQWQGDVDFYNSGDIYTKLAWLSNYKNKVRAVIEGLPTILPTLSAFQDGDNTLVFRLAGTLQSVNGKAASGTDLSQFNLGTKGSIVISGKTYKWRNFRSVTGTVIPPARQAAGPSTVSSRQSALTEAVVTWGAVPGATSYNVKRAQTSTGPYTTIAAGVTGTKYTDATAYPALDSYYVVSAVVNNIETANSPEASLRHQKLNGTPIGSVAAANGVNVNANAFDSDRDSYFETTAANGGWVGLDFGSGTAPVVTRVAFSPRHYNEARMVGGLIQGANHSDFSDAVTLYTIARKPLDGILTAIDFTNTTAYRYVRYVGPSNSYSSISELQFYAR